jgi:hypothetical protein
MQIMIWTSKPTDLVYEACKWLQLRDQSDAQPLSLMKFGKFNGAVITFIRLSVSHLCALEDAAVRMGLRYDATQEKDLRIYDVRVYPSSISSKREKGAHDAEIDLWHCAVASYPHTYYLINPSNPTGTYVQENSPQEALMNLVLGTQETLARLQSQPVDKKIQEQIEHTQGYLEYMRKFLPLFDKRLYPHDERDNP